MFRRKKKWEFTINEFTIFGVFVAVVLGGLAFGTLILATGAYEEDPYLPEEIVEVPVAPTPEEYMTAAREVLTPLVAQAELIDAAYFAGDTSAMLLLVEKTQERLLRVRVPAEYREPHLSFVLLLEQWKRALNGSPADQDVVVQRTVDLVDENPWLL